MKTFACILLLAAVVSAEPPRYRIARFRSERQELSGDGEEGQKSAGGEAPYAAAGFKPTREFNLPARHEVSPPSTSYGTPDDSYGAPFKTYAAPQVEYGVPEKKQSEEHKAKEKVEKHEGSEVEKLKESKEAKESKNSKETNEGKEKKAKLEEEPKKEAEVLSAEGAYYVLLPGSQLQRVQFQTENDIRNMAYTARLQYRNEDRAPLFVYTAVPQFQSAAYVQLL
ncbi:unnamed protein product [Diatraea saccharalis]|uniref:DUF4794 domain-containing protein n=1 Tax=Diatraea saccharalis TaxID=40085 RepID=A0A9N9WCP6_9NEOP|nr:unnamed protein product [Diatraea saccharalis]